MSQTTLGPLGVLFEIPDLPTLSLQDRFAVIGSWFLGPRAENAGILSETTKLIVDEIETGRKEYFPEDPVRCLYSRLILVTNSRPLGVYPLGHAK